ncbi:TPA: methionine adenosyltransferase [Candidatus Nomurabacteria bacterium]|nr:MAG: S-adenosylmethionine synthase [Parcubacteria bacterium RAAC4_OD1_1]HCY26180.1 methionine adenosyltransferase [Candidatus Nomurabacteria bacterium]
MKKTAECVSPMHPDKICDFIADNILDAYLEEDKNSRCAIEVMGGHNLITINGEVTSGATPDIEKVVKSLVGNNFKVICNIVKQSPEIARGVVSGGAGDQGIMKGYATSETSSLMPLEYELARSLCNYIYDKYPYDGKTQITTENGCINTIIASFQNAPKKELEKLVMEWFKKHGTKSNKIFQYEVFINPAGDWSLGGFDADTGLSGRKLIVDNYGPEIPIGGGSFSGKDYTKVDRSGAYMARKIAVDLLKKHKAKEVHTKLAYAIGKAEPVMAVASIDGLEIEIKGYDLTPKGIYEYLNLQEVKFSKTSNWGHFGRDFTWN